MEIPNVRALTDEQFRSMSLDKSKLFFVVPFIRPNILVWATDLEHTHYEPHTPRNNKFQLYTSQWQGMLWLVVQIPIEDRNMAEAMADKYHLRIVDDTPIIINADGIVRFPLRGDNVISIENTDQMIDIEEEINRCQEIHREFEAHSCKWNLHLN